MSRKSGKHFEEYAARFLQKKGLKLLTQNFPAYRGELDLVMRDGETLVFVEVKFRKNSNFGSAAETVTLKKQQHMVLAAQFYLQSHQQFSQLACRFDVIAINGTSRQDDNPKIDWIKNAFLIT